MDEEELYCTFCKNRCPLSHPKCANVNSPEMAERRRAGAAFEASTCKMCEKRCPLDALECSLGRTIHSIKTNKRTEQ